MPDPATTPQPDDVEKENPSGVADEGLKFEVIEKGKFTIDNMLVQGSVEATLKLRGDITATYRTLSVEEIQKVESVLPVAAMREKSVKFLQNEMTVAQLYYSLVALNGKALPEVGDGGKDDKRMSLLRNLPGVFFDLLTRGFNEFDRRSQELVSGENLRNF